MNKLIVAGIVRSKPIYKQLHGEAQMWINLDIFRGDLNGKTEKLTLLTRDEALMKRVLLSKIQKGDLFITDSAFIESVNYTEDDLWVCPECGENNTNPHQAEIANAVFTDYMYAHDFINEASEIGINEVALSGRIITEPVMLPTTTSTVSDFYRCKCKIACKYYDVIAQEAKICYPFIVFFGKSAQYFMEHAKVGDHINLAGSFQERQYLKQKKNVVCENCEKTTTSNIWQTVREIIVQNFDLAAADKMKRDTSVVSDEEDSKN